MSSKRRLSGSQSASVKFRKDIPLVGRDSHEGQPQETSRGHLGLLIDALRVKVCFVRQPCLLFRGVGLLSFLF